MARQGRAFPSCYSTWSCLIARCQPITVLGTTNCSITATLRDGIAPELPHPTYDLRQNACEVGKGEAYAEALEIPPRGPSKSILYLLNRLCIAHFCSTATKTLTALRKRNCMALQPKSSHAYKLLPGDEHGRGEFKTKRRKASFLRKNECCFVFLISLLGSAFLFTIYGLICLYFDRSPSFSPTRESFR